MKSFPCKDCEERTLGCHGACERYAQTRKEVWEDKTARWKAYEADSYLRSVVVRNKVYKIKEKARR